MPIYHGGCHGCHSSYTETPVCLGCQYFEANWNLPDLNQRHKEEKEAKARQKLRLQKMASK